MMQIVHDVAPGARLLFRTATGGMADMAQGILDAADHFVGVDVMVDDVLYLAEPMFQDGVIAQAAVTLVWEGEQWSYGALAGRVDVLARALRRRGVGPETLVGLAFEPSPDMVVGLLAIHRAGGAYLPLDPSYPEKRIAFIGRPALGFLARQIVPIHTFAAMTRVLSEAEQAALGGERECSWRPRGIVSRSLASSASTSSRPRATPAPASPWAPPWGVCWLSWRWARTHRSCATCWPCPRPPGCRRSRCEVWGSAGPSAG